MSNLNFNIDSTVKENLNKTVFPVKIHNNCTISSAEYVEEYDCLDIVIESDSHKYRERMFNPLKNIPTWTTAEKQLANFQSRIVHFLKRFMVLDETNKIQGNTFQEMCVNVANAINEHAVSKKVPFSVKFVYDKNFQYPKLPATGRVIALSTEEPLSYTKWEKENVLLPETTNGEETSSPSASSGEDLF